MTGRIHSFESFGTVDGPGIRFVVFLQGCPLRCQYCHNPDTWKAGGIEYSVEDVATRILRYRNYFGEKGGVTVSGGEPLLQSDLIPFLEKVKELGYAVKLDTNGSLPHRLQTVLSTGLVDYVAMDIKNGPGSYGIAVGLKNPDLAKIEESIRILLEGAVDYEFRTTVALPLHSEESVADMARWLQTLGGGKKAKRLFLQPFVDRDTVPVTGLSAPDERMLARFSGLLTSCAEEVAIRGVK